MHRFHPDATTLAYRLLLILPAFGVAPAAAWPPAGSDIAPWIQGYSDRNELVPQLPVGHYKLGSTIRLPRRDGGRLVGAGAVSPRANSTHRGPGTILEYTGPRDEPAITVTGSNWKIGSFALTGVPRKSDAPRPSIGLLVTKTARGVGTGKHTLDDLHVSNFQTAIRCGLSGAEHNNDHIGYEHLVIENCDRGLFIENHQSMGHFIDRLECRRTGVAIEFKGGGILHCKNWFLVGNNATLLKISDGGKYSPGSNNNLFVLTGGKVDAQHDGHLTLIDVDHRSSRAVIKVNETMVSGPVPWTLVDSDSDKVQVVIDTVLSPAAVVHAKGGKVHQQGFNRLNLRGEEIK